MVMLKVLLDSRDSERLSPEHIVRLHVREQKKPYARRHVGLSLEAYWE